MSNLLTLVDSAPRREEDALEQDRKKAKKYTYGAMNSARYKHYTTNPIVHTIVSKVIRAFNLMYSFIYGVVVLVFCFVVSNSYYVALAALYIANMTSQSADLLHAIYCMFHNGTKPHTFCSALFHYLLCTSYNCKTTLDFATSLFPIPHYCLVSVQCILL